MTHGMPGLMNGAQIHVSITVHTAYTSPCRRVSNVCEDTLGFLKQTKHKAWRDGMLSIYGGCAKAFIPSLKQGLITHMYLPLSSDTSVYQA